MPTVSAMARFEIDLRSPVPSYRQLADQLRAEIASGAIGHDQALPSIRLMVQDTGLDPKTVRHAVEVLAGEGLVVTVRGRGTFARRPDAG